MGTTTEWLRVAGFGVFFMVFMLVVNLNIDPKPFASPRGIGKLLNVCNFVACVLAVGMFTCLIGRCCSTGN